MMDLTDEQFIGYCEIHCETPRALFNGAQIKRICKLAKTEALGIDDDAWFSVKDEMKDLCKKARELVDAPTSESGRNERRKV